MFTTLYMNSIHGLLVLSFTVVTDL